MILFSCIFPFFPVFMPFAGVFYLFDLLNLGGNYIINGICDIIKRGNNNGFFCPTIDESKQVSPAKEKNG
jgi:hypothetical protein